MRRKTIQHPNNSCLLLRAPELGAPIHTFRLNEADHQQLFELARIVRHSRDASRIAMARPNAARGRCPNLRCTEGPPPRRRCRLELHNA